MLFSVCTLGLPACADASGEFAQQPLISHIYTADPSAHVWHNKIYLYPSHDIDSATPYPDEGGAFVMRDYHVFSMESINGEVIDHGVALDVDDVPWATRQLWAPDAAHKDGNYFLYFPAKDADGVFRIGVASSTSPTGPFTAEPEPIAGSYSNDPTVYAGADGAYYLYIGGIGGGQLQRWRNGEYTAEDHYPADDQPAIKPRVAKLSADMRSIAEPFKEIEVLTPEGTPILAGDHNRRFFEGAWLHKHQGTYYLSYSTGNTHNIVYATGKSPYGPFTYQGVLLEPVQGWTSQHSTVEVDGQWYLFYHDTQLSEGKTHLRNVKVMSFEHSSDGRIQPLSAFR